MTDVIAWTFTDEAVNVERAIEDIHEVLATESHAVVPFHQMHLASLEDVVETADGDVALVIDIRYRADVVTLRVTTENGEVFTLEA